MPARSRHSSRYGVAPSLRSPSPQSPISARFVAKTPGFVSASNTPKPLSVSKKKLQPCWGYRCRRPSATRRHDAGHHCSARQERPYGKRLCRSRTGPRQRLSRPHASSPAAPFELCQARAVAGASSLSDLAENRDFLEYNVFEAAGRRKIAVLSGVLIEDSCVEGLSPTGC